MVSFENLRRYGLGILCFWQLLAATTLLLSINPGHAQNAPSAADQVQSDVRDLLSAFYQRDLDSYLKFTHPKAAEIAGSDNLLRVELGNIFRMMGALDMRMDQLTFPSPPQFLDGDDGRRFVVVETQMLTSMNKGQKAEALSFQLGILDAGSRSWKYLEGKSSMGKYIHKLFPDFPADFKFSQIYIRPK